MRRAEIVTMIAGWPPPASQTTNPDRGGSFDSQHANTAVARTRPRTSAGRDRPGAGHAAGGARLAQRGSANPGQAPAGPALAGCRRFSRGGGAGLVGLERQGLCPRHSPSSLPGRPSQLPDRFAGKGRAQGRQLHRHQIRVGRPGHHHSPGRGRHPGQAWRAAGRTGQRPDRREDSGHRDQGGHRRGGLRGRGQGTRHPAGRGRQQDP